MSNRILDRISTMINTSRYYINLADRSTHIKALAWSGYTNCSRCTVQCTCCTSRSAMCIMQLKLFHNIENWLHNLGVDLWQHAYFPTKQVTNDYNLFNKHQYICPRATVEDFRIIFLKSVLLWSGFRSHGVSTHLKWDL